MFWPRLANLGLLLAYYLVNMMGGKGSHIMSVYLGTWTAWYTGNRQPHMWQHKSNNIIQIILIHFPVQISLFTVW